MTEDNLNDQMNYPSKENRYFIPIVPVHIKPEVLKNIMPYTNWIGFNLFDLRGSKFYDAVKRKGIRDTFEIDDGKRIFLASTGKDEKLVPFYDNQDGIEQFRADVKDFDADMVMGPDWFVYEDQLPEDRRKNIAKAIELNKECIDLENVVPNIHGTNFQEIRSFIESFKEHGKRLFVMAGRGRLINLGNRKKSQNRFSSLTSTIVTYEKIRLIVTGCNSPKLQENLPAVSAFAGLGWLIQARNRRLIMGKTYRRIFDPGFFCDDFSCCASLSKEELARKEKESARAIHNLKRIVQSLTARPAFWQYSLVS
jgi:hypothetical protein